LVLRNLFLSKLSTAPNILGSGGSRVLVNGHAHVALEERLARLFHTPTALLFNSGFDANAGVFSCIPQMGDAIVFDEYIHASVHEGMRTSRVQNTAQLAFSHNSVSSLRAVLQKLRNNQGEANVAKSSVFVAVESLYSMDGTIAPLKEIVEVVEELFPDGNGHVIVDEAHATGIYGPQGKGLVALLGLESRVLIRLVTFGKALAGTGAVVLASEIIRDYLQNYARPLIYTTGLSYPNIILADCSFDMLENGTAEELAKITLDLSAYFVHLLRPHLIHIPPTVLSLHPHLQLNPSPIVPIMTTRPTVLSTYMIEHGIRVLPVRWPTVPRGKERVRVCMHAGNTRADVEKLVDVMISWAQEEVRKDGMHLKDGTRISKL